MRTDSSGYTSFVPHRSPDAPAGRTIGYYVHHHGTGHRSRFAKILVHADSHLVPLSELEVPGGVRLVSDVPSGPVDPTAAGSLHWAPVGSAASARRTKQIVDWIVAARPIGAVVDVSVEAALQFRLAGVPTVVVRQHGERTDSAHVLAYRSAARLLAPYPIELEHPDTPQWILDKTTHCGFIMESGTQPRPVDHRIDLGKPQRDDVVVLWGSGGGQLSNADLECLAQVVRPGRLWLAGHITGAPTTEHDNVVRLGFVDDVQSLLTARPTVVASAGNNTVADVALSGSPLVVVPLDRPFDEQLRHAQSLDSAGVAAIADASAGSIDWSGAIATARQRAPALARLARSDGACRAAELIDAAFDAATS